MGMACWPGYACLEHSPQVATLTLQHDGTRRLTTDQTYDNLNRLSSIASENSPGIEWLCAGRRLDVGSPPEFFQRSTWERRQTGGLRYGRAGWHGMSVP